MDKNNALLNEHTKDFFIKTREKIIHSHNIALNRINTYSDEEKFIVLTIDYSLKFHSINISEKVFGICDKKEIIEHMIKLFNRAIIKSSIIGADEVKNSVSSKEIEEIISNENQELKDEIKKIQEKIMQSLRQQYIKTKTVVSDNGNITFVFSGDKMIKSISISDEYFSTKKKSLLETELLQTVNKALQEIQKEFQIIFNKNEEEIRKTLIRE